MAGAKGSRIPTLPMFLLVLLKSLLLRRNRVAITFFSITIGATIISALSSVYFDISSKMSRELRAYGANFFIGPPLLSGSRIADSKTIDEAIAMIPADKLIGSSRHLYGVVRLDLGNAVLVGVDFVGLRKLSTYWQVEGKWVGVDFDDGSCMVGKTLAKNMDLKVGDGVAVIKEETGFRQKLVVRGIVETGQVEDNQIFVNLSTAGEILGLEGQAHHAMLSIITDGLDIEALAAEVERRFPGLDAKPIRNISYSDGRILEKIKGLMAIVALVILTVTSLCVMTTLIATVSERTREIGLMKAIGAHDRSVALQFFSETLIIGVAGVAAGLGSGFLLAQVIGHAVFRSYISFRLIVIPMTLIPSLATALFAAALPVRMAVRIVPAQVLKEE